MELWLWRGELLHTVPSPMGLDGMVSGGALLRMPSRLPQSSAPVAQVFLATRLPKPARAVPARSVATAVVSVPSSSWRGDFQPVVTRKQPCNTCVISTDATAAP